MTVQDLKEALEAFIKNELPELQKMEDYYSGKHNILNKKNEKEWSFYYDRLLQNTRCFRRC